MIHFMAASALKMAWCGAWCGALQLRERNKGTLGRRRCGYGGGIWGLYFRVHTASLVSIWWEAVASQWSIWFL